MYYGVFEDGEGWERGRGMGGGRWAMFGDFQMRVPIKRSAPLPAN